MKHYSHSPVRRKPAGGVRYAAITTAANIAKASFSDDGRLCTDLQSVDAEAVMHCRLVEDRSSFVETLEVDGGAAAVTHTLRLVADRDLAAAWLERDFVDEAMTRGVVAVVKLSDGRRAVAGISPKFGLEQPLRLRKLTVDSGSKPADAPLVEMVLESADTAFAAELQN